jgi:hypothetical protein
MNNTPGEGEGTLLRPNPTTLLPSLQFHGPSRRLLSGCYDTVGSFLDCAVNTVDQAAADTYNYFVGGANDVADALSTPSRSSSPSYYVSGSSTSGNTNTVVMCVLGALASGVLLA